MIDYKKTLEAIILHLKFIDKLVSDDTYSLFVPVITEVINLIYSNFQMLLGTFDESEIIEVSRSDSSAIFGGPLICLSLKEKIKNIFENNNLLFQINKDEDIKALHKLVYRKMYRIILSDNYDDIFWEQTEDKS